MKKVKRKYNSTSRKLKAAGIQGGIEVPRMPRKGAWQLAKESGKVPGAPKTRKKGAKPLEYDQDVIIEMARDRAGGATTHEIAQKYEVSNVYVDEALKKLWLNTSIGKEILKGVLLENAVAFGMQARKKMSELNGMQSVVATGIMTSRLVELERHAKDMPQEVDLASVAAAADRLDQLAQSVGGAALMGPSIFETTPTEEDPE